MDLRKPTVEELIASARSNNFRPTEDELAGYEEIISETIASLERLDEMPEPHPAVKYSRTAGRRPTKSENTLGAWAWKCSVEGASAGRLRGKQVAVKDVISVAGTPLAMGSAVMEGFISDIDATVVTRILDAGGQINGKATCENFCFSGGSHTSYPEPVRNPHDTTRWAGGSSSGSAALVAVGECDIALGCDQGGSIREPSSFCGIYGLKPTYGLVPYTGIASIDPSLDHVGPMARSVADIALLLEVIAGPDGWDSRQVGLPHELPKYSHGLDAGCKGLRFGVVKEGFAWPGSEEDVDSLVRSAAEELRQLGGDVREVSIPVHRDGVTIFTGVALEGAWSTMLRDSAASRGLTTYYDTALIDFTSRALRSRAAALPHTMKVVALLAAYLAEHYPSHYYAKGQNLRRKLKAQYDSALESVDILLMPTTPQKAIPFDSRRTIAEDLRASLSTIQNGCATGLTGHPAITLPCGYSEGLPVGITLVGRWWEEQTLLRAATAFEALGYYRPPSRAGH